MVEEYDATLASIALLIENRDTLEKNLRRVVGVDLEGEPLSEGPMPIEQTPWAQKTIGLEAFEGASRIAA